MIKHHDLGDALAKFLRITILRSKSHETKKSIELLFKSLAENDSLLRWLEKNNKMIDVFNATWEKQGDPLKPLIEQTRNNSNFECRNFYSKVTFHN